MTPRERKKERKEVEIMGLVRAFEARAPSVNFRVGQIFRRGNHSFQ